MAAWVIKKQSGSEKQRLEANKRGRHLIIITHTVYTCLAESIVPSDLTYAVKLIDSVSTDTMDAVNIGTLIRICRWSENLNFVRNCEAKIGTRRLPFPYTRHESEITTTYIILNESHSPLWNVRTGCKNKYDDF